MGITYELCKWIKSTYESGYSCKQIAEALNLNENLIKSIVSH
jgi:DNA-binding CsgD family transcriptional regulator